MKKPMAILTGTVMLLGTVSCKKIDTPRPETKLTVSKEGDYKRGDFVFSLSNLRKITRPRSVSGGGDQIVPSHLYVRFKPTTQAHIDAIEEKNIPTYPYPLATDSLDVSNPDYSTLYTFLSLNKTLPNCPYEILDTVMMLRPESPGTAQAYAAAGKVNRVSLPLDGRTSPRFVDQNVELEPMPCDQWSDPESGGGGHPIGVEQPIDCIDCGCGGGGGTPPPPAPLRPAEARTAPFTVTYNSCSMNTDVNYPSGRITVEETQWGNGGVAFEGVADVKVEILGPNGQRVVAYTNRYGCFKATDAIRGFRLFGSAVFPVVQNVVFESGRKEIRGYNDMANLSQYTQPLKHIYANIAERMNNANVYYQRNTNDQDNDCKYYVAATVNNALYEFDEYAAQDGLITPPSNLKILVHRFAGSAAAPMFNIMKNTHPIEYITIKAFFDATTLGIGTYVSNKPPDIAYGYGFSSTDGFATDKIKETAYHEYAHASHYQKTSFQFWVDNINFVTHNGSYGNTSDPQFEKSSLAEMWGYFIGREYAHRRYGPNAHSNLNPPFQSGTPTFSNSWYAWNENYDHELILEHIHIASGFLHDIRDDNVYNIANLLDENNVVTPARDRISGYTIGTIYNFLDSDTRSPTTLINKLRNVLPSGITDNTLANYDTLRAV